MLRASALIATSRALGLAVGKSRPRWVYRPHRIACELKLVPPGGYYFSLATRFLTSSVLHTEDELLDKAKLGDVGSIAEVGRQYLDMERGDSRTCRSEARKWLELAAELGHTESKFQLGILLTSSDKSTDAVVDASAIPDVAGDDSNRTGNNDVRAEKAKTVWDEIKATAKANRKSRAEKHRGSSVRSKSSTTASGDVVKIDHSTDKPAVPGAHASSVASTNFPATGASIGTAGNPETSEAAQKPTVGLSPKEQESDAIQAINWLRQAASSNHGKAMVYLGNILLKQGGSPADSFEALLWYERAARLPTPVPDALYNLGTLYFDGVEGQLPPDLKKSLTYFQKAADLGDASALFWLGHCHLSGEGGFDGVVNPKAAVNYLTEAAEEGHAGAHYYLAALYRSGLQASSGKASVVSAASGQCDGNGGCGGKGPCHSKERNHSSHDHNHDHDHSHSHGHSHNDDSHSHSRSCGNSKNNKNSCSSKHINIGTSASAETEDIVTSTSSTSSSTTSSSTTENHSKITAAAPADADDNSINNIPPNKELFLHHLMAAVELEEPDALYCLADMHVQGLEGYTVDLVKGRELYERASARGHLEATVCLGAMHYNGIAGLDKDARKAFELYNIAAEGGSADAWRNLAAMYFAGDGVPKSEEMAREIMRVIFGVVEGEEKKR